MYSMISAQSTTVVLDGKPHVVAASHPQYEQLVSAIRERRETAVRDILYAGQRIAEALAQFGDISIFGGHVTYKGQPFHDQLIEKLLQAQDPAPIGNFLNRIMQNPSSHVRAALWDWCEKHGFPITPDGLIVAIKLISVNYTDPDTAEPHVVGQETVTQAWGLYVNPIPTRGSRLPNRRALLVSVDPADVKEVGFSLIVGKLKVLEEIPVASIYDYFKGGFVLDRSVEDELKQIEDQLDLDGFGESIEDRIELIASQLGCGATLEEIRNANRHAA